MDNTDKLREISKSIVNFAFENPDNEPILLGIIEQIQSETLEYGKQLGREETLREIEPILRKAIHAMMYAGWNYDGSKYENFDKSIVDSTGVSDSLYISVNEFELLLNQLKEQKKWQTRK